VLVAAVACAAISASLGVAALAVAGGADLRSILRRLIEHYIAKGLPA
jgi:hypothetical protein